MYTYALDRPSTLMDNTGYQTNEPKVIKTEVGTKSVRVHNATGKTLQQQWKIYFESLPDVEKVIEQSRLKDPVTKKGIGSGKGTGPKDLAVVWKVTKEAIIVEVSTEKEFAKAEVNSTSRKAYQAKHTRETLAREGGAVVGNEKVGYFKATESWEAKGSPMPQETYKIPGHPAAKPKVEVRPQVVSRSFGPSTVELDPKPTGPAYGLMALEIMHNLAEDVHATREHESRKTTFTKFSHGLPQEAVGRSMLRLAYEIIEGAKMTPGLIKRGLAALMIAFKKTAEIKYKWMKEQESLPWYSRDYRAACWGPCR